MKNRRQFVLEAASVASETGFPALSLTAARPIGRCAHRAAPGLASFSYEARGVSIRSRNALSPRPAYRTASRFLQGHTSSTKSIIVRIDILTDKVSLHEKRFSYISKHTRLRAEPQSRSRGPSAGSLEPWRGDRAGDQHAALRTRPLII